MRADLHTHSTASDGTDAPGDLPRLAKQAGLDAFALTDHDTTAGLAQAAAAAKKIGITFVPGIEISVLADPFAQHSPLADEQHNDPPAGAVHLLGYHVQPQSEALTIIETKLRRARENRNPKIIDKLAELGVRIDYQDVLKIAKNDAKDDAKDELSEQPENHTIGRPHIAQLLVQRGYVKSIHEAFARYLGQGAPAYVPRELPTAQRAIDAVHAAGGVAVLAHPVHLGLNPDQLEHHIARLTDLGLDGIETQHPDHEPNDTKQLAALARQFDLIPTGGSDYHGSRKAIGLGSVLAPDDALQQLEQAAAAYGKV